MSLDSSEKSANKTIKNTGSQRESASISLVPEAANQEPEFKSAADGKFSKLKYPLILLALGLIFTALTLENPDAESVAEKEIQSTQGLLQSGSSSGGGDARAWLENWKKTSSINNVDAVFTRAESFTANDQQADAWLLYFYAARNGHGAAAMTLAHQADPQTFSEQQSITGIAEPFSAFKWYKVAAATGVPEASAKLAALKTWLQAEAKKGDADAGRLLLQWP